MEANLVNELKNQTGASEDLCYTLLETQGWDLTSALVAYMQLSDLTKSESTDKFDDGRNNISGSWRATHDKSYLNTFDSSSLPSFVQPATVKIDGVPNSKPILQKSEAIDVVDCKKLARGISRATDNENIVSQVRSECAQDVSINRNPNIDQFYIDTPEYTFTLPDFSIYSEDFRKFLEKDLLENSSLVSLEQSGRLNWWSSTGATKLWPLATCGDGNCLPHAASLGLWGFHDRLLTLRKLLHNALLAAPWRHALRRRWRWSQTRQHLQSGLVLSNEEWESEWAALVELAAPSNHSLEEIHVFALAHTLRRPIIVIADVLLRDLNGEALAPIPFGGIYLPLECSADDCHKSPLILAYDMGHFSALVVMETDTPGKSSPSLPPVIPLSDSEGCLLPIQFSVDPGDDFEWNKDENDQKIINRLVLSEKDQINLLCEYLDVVYLSPSSSPGQEEPDIIDVSEEDITNKFSETLTTNNEIDQPEHALFENKSKTTKQLQSVAKQFGSIGKSMGNKLKKNFVSITKIKANNANKKPANNTIFSSSKYKLLCCQLRAKRHDIQDKMVKNYLEYAEYRFSNSEKKDFDKRNLEMASLKEQAMLEGRLKCVNSGCVGYGTVLTSYLCHECFQKQRQQELSEVHNMNSINNLNNYNGMPRYGTGKSKFYAEADHESHNVIKRMPATSVVNNDHTLYLSNSTFYNDSGKPSSMSARFVTNADSQNQTLPTDVHWRSILTNDNLNVKSDGYFSKKDKSKRSTLPANKIHVTATSYKTGWDSDENCLPENDESNNVDIFNEPQPCRTPLCLYFGSPLSDNLCSKCCETANSTHVINIHRE